MNPPYPDPHVWPASRVVGRCPACGGESLFLGAGGHITCSRLECPRPTAVDELLEDRETEHVVELRDTDFTVRHPLRERMDDALMECAIHARIAALDGPPRAPGRYRVRVDPDGAWFWLAVALAAPLAEQHTTDEWDEES